MTRQETAPAAAPNCFQAAAHNHLISQLQPGVAGGPPAVSRREAAQVEGWANTERMLPSKPPAAHVPRVSHPPNKKKGIEQEARAQHSSAETKAQWKLARRPALK